MAHVSHIHHSLSLSRPNHLLSSRDSDSDSDSDSIRWSLLDGINPTPSGDWSRLELLVSLRTWFSDPRRRGFTASPSIPLSHLFSFPASMSSVARFPYQKSLVLFALFDFQIRNLKTESHCFTGRSWNRSLAIRLYIFLLLMKTSLESGTWYKSQKLLIVNHRLQ